MDLPIISLLCVGLFLLVTLSVLVLVAVAVAMWLGNPDRARAPVSRNGAAWGFGAAAGLLLLLVLVSWTTIESHDVAVRQRHTQMAAQDALEAQIQLEEKRARMEAMRSGLPLQAAHALQRLDDSATTETADTELVRLPEEDAAISAVDVQTTTLPQSDRTTVEGANGDPPPSWISEGHTNEGDAEFLVVSSGQYASQEEAIADADAQVAEILEEDLRRFTDHAVLRPRRSPIAGTDVQRVVRREYMQSVQRDFGSFFAPMYRVWYRVELSPAVREPYLVSWKHQVTEARTFAVGAAFASLLLLPLAILFSSAATRATGGRGARAFRVAAFAGVVVMWAAVAMFLNQSVVLWN